MSRGSRARNRNSGESQLMLTWNGPGRSTTRTQCRRSEPGGTRGDARNGTTATATSKLATRSSRTRVLRSGVRAVVTHTSRRYGHWPESRLALAFDLPNAPRTVPCRSVRRGTRLSLPNVVAWRRSDGRLCDSHHVASRLYDTK